MPKWPTYFWSVISLETPVLCFHYWDFLTNFWCNNWRSIIAVVENLCYRVNLSYPTHAPSPSCSAIPENSHSIILMQGLSQLDWRVNISAKLPAVFVGFLNFLLFSYMLRVASYVFFCKFPSNNCNYSNQNFFQKTHLH